MLPGSRDAPMTATACGSSIGRSEAAVAAAVPPLRPRQHPSADGVSDRRHGRRAAVPISIGFRTRSRGTPRASRGCRRSVVASKRRNPFAAAIAASRSSRLVREALALEAIVDRERRFGRARRRSRSTSRRRSAAASPPTWRTATSVTLRCWSPSRTADSSSASRRFAGSEEAVPPRLRRQLVEEPPQRLADRRASSGERWRPCRRAAPAVGAAASRRRAVTAAIGCISGLGDAPRGRRGWHELTLGMSDGQHRARRGPDDALGDAAHQQVCHGAAAVCADDDQIAAVPIVRIDVWTCETAMRILVGMGLIVRGADGSFRSRRDVDVKQPKRRLRR